MMPLYRKGSGPKLVLLHCLGMSHRMWDCLDALADRFELIACDFPGHGAAPVPSLPYGVEDLSEQLAAALRAEGIDRAHVAGLSLGGCVAQHFAASEPGMVDRLVLCDTTPCYDNDARANWAARAMAARRHGPYSLLQEIEPIWFTAEYLARDPVPAGLASMRQSFAACPPEGYALACEALATVDLIDMVGEIYARTLVLCGAHERLAFREAADWLAQSIAGAKLAFVPNAAHASVLEQPRWVEAALRSFLS